MQTTTIIQELDSLVVSLRQQRSAQQFKLIKGLPNRQSMSKEKHRCALTQSQRPHVGRPSQTCLYTHSTC
eukprot:scaffold22801_cov20-Tisochrysis_lutea.AAC.5